MDIKQAIINAGGYSKVAEKIGETKQVVWSWVNVLGRVPAEKVMTLESAIGVSRAEIRPDIYPAEREPR